MKATERVKAALGKPSQETVEQWWDALLAKAAREPGRQFTKRYGMGKCAMSIVVPPVPKQRKAGPES